MIPLKYYFYSHIASQLGRLYANSSGHTSQLKLLMLNMLLSLFYKTLLTLSRFDSIYF